MKLGNHTIGLRNTSRRVDGDGEPVLDEYGDQVVDVVDVKVPWCNVTPTTRTSENNREPEDRSGPVTVGTQLLAPPGTGVRADSVVVWPITGEVGAGADLELSGPTWQVIGEVGVWDESEEAQLRRSS